MLGEPSLLTNSLSDENVWVSGIDIPIKPGLANLAFWMVSFDKDNTSSVKIF